MRTGFLAAVVLGVMAWVSGAHAQQKVIPGYQVCSNATGVQICSWVATPADANGNLGVSVAGCSSSSCAVQADTSAPINVSTATTTQIVALVAAKKIYVTSYNVIAGGTGNITFVYGTGSNCGTGTTVLTGAYPLVAQSGIAIGSGLGPILIVPAGNALCVTTTQAVQMSGSVSYTQAQ